MISNTTQDVAGATSLTSQQQLREIDPIALGQAGLQALALAGTAILARYARTDGSGERMTELVGTLPHPDWSILMRAIGAFAEPAQACPEDERRHAEAVVAMCLRARTAIARKRRLSPRGAG